MKKICPKHGLTEFFYSEAEKCYRCKQCRIDNVADKRRRNKIELVKYKGGKNEINENIKQYEQNFGKKV